VFTPGRVELAGCSVNVDPLILAPLALGTAPTAAMVVTPLAEGIA